MKRMQSQRYPLAAVLLLVFSVMLMEEGEPDTSVKNNDCSSTLLTCRVADGI